MITHVPALLSRNFIIQCNRHWMTQSRPEHFSSMQKRSLNIHYFSTTPGFQRLNDDWQWFCTSETSLQRRPTLPPPNNDAGDTVTPKEGWASGPGILEVRGSRLPREGGGCGVKSRASEPRRLWMVDAASVLLSCVLLARLRVSHRYREDTANKRSCISTIRLTNGKPWF